MNKQLFGKGFKKRNTLRKTVRDLTEKLADPTVDPTARARAFDEIEKGERIRNERMKVLIDGVKVVGTLTILAVVAKWGHEKETSDEIIQNKNSFNMFTRMAKL